MSSLTIQTKEHGFRPSRKKQYFSRHGKGKGAQILALLMSVPGRWFSNVEIVRRVPVINLSTYLHVIRRNLEPNEQIICHQVTRPGTRNLLADYAYVRDRRVWAFSPEIAAMRRYHGLPEVPDYLAGYDVHEPTAEERAAATDVLAGLTHNERWLEAQRREQQDHAERVSAAGAEHPGLPPGEALEAVEAREIREHQEQRRAEAAAVLKAPATLAREEQARQGQRVVTHPPEDLPGQTTLFAPPAEHERRAGA